MTALVCTGCGAVADGLLPLRCPNATSGDGADHVLTRPRPDVSAGDPDRFARDLAEDPHPFIRYRRFLRVWSAARAAGLSDDEYARTVRELDAAVARVEGRGFSVTPCAPSAPLGARLGLGEDGLIVKDDTGNVGGSHKARHLFGLALAFETAARAGHPEAALRDRPLAIASCGNAALAAAVVARAMERELRVFVPPWADAAVITRLDALGARIERCPRRPDDPPGDPCHHRFREAVRDGEWPFSVQGSDNALVIDGGMTLAFEFAELCHAHPVDRLFVQVGGGALASAVAQGLAIMAASGAIGRALALHAVQAEGGFPLVRAWRRVARRLTADAGIAEAPAHDDESGRDAARRDARAAAWIAANTSAAAREAALSLAARERAHFMTAWEAEPASAASGILDDEAYDWVAVVRGLLDTGGSPVAAPETAILEAHALGHASGFNVSATGSASLAGALTLHDASPSAFDALRPAVLFTGVER